MSDYTENLQADENKANYEGLKQENRRIVQGLEQLLSDESITDKTTFVAKLKEMGLGLQEGFEAKEFSEMKGEAEAVLKQMREMFSGALRVTANVDDSATIASEARETTDISNIEAQLAELSERFISVDAVNNALKSLKGVNVEISEAEIARLKSLLPNELTDAHKEAIAKLKEACEGDSDPLIMQLPTKIMVDGKEMPFTIATMHEIMRKAKEAGSLNKPLWLSDYVTQATKSQKWNSELGVWTSTCLKGSKSMKYRGTGGQLEHQKVVLGEDREIHADMILAIALRYIQNGEELMRSDFMRLNDLDSVGDPLLVFVYDCGLYLGRSSGVAHSLSGVGGSLRISS